MKSISTGCGKRADRLAAAKQLRHGLAPFVAVVLCELVDVHPDEAVGNGGVDAATELQRVLERVRSVVEAALDRVTEHV